MPSLKKRKSNAILVAVVILATIFLIAKGKAPIGFVAKPLARDQVQSEQPATFGEDGLCNAYTNIYLGGYTEYIEAVFSQARQAPILVHETPQLGQTLSEVNVRETGQDGFFGTFDDITNPRTLTSGMPWTFAKVSAINTKEALVFVALDDPNNLNSRRIIAIEQSGPNGRVGDFDDLPRQKILLKNPPRPDPYNEGFAFDVVVLPNGETVVVWSDLDFRQVYVIKDRGTGQLNAETPTIGPQESSQQQPFVFQVPRTVALSVAKNGFVFTSSSYTGPIPVLNARTRRITDLGPDFIPSPSDPHIEFTVTFNGYDINEDHTDDGALMAWASGPVENMKINRNRVDMFYAPDGRLNSNARIITGVYTTPDQRLLVRDVALVKFEGSTPPILLVLLAPEYFIVTGPAFIAAVSSGQNGVFGDSDDVTLPPQFTGQLGGSYHSASYLTGTYAMLNNQFRIFSMFMGNEITTFTFC